MAEQVDLIDLLADLVRALDPLMNEDFCQPFASAWELDPHVGYPNGYPDGEEIFEHVRQAWAAAKEATDA